MVHGMPTFLNPAVSAPIAKRILRHAEKLSGLLDGHEFAQFRHRSIPDQNPGIAYSQLGLQNLTKDTKGRTVGLDGGAYGAWIRSRIAIDPTTQ